MLAYLTINASAPGSCQAGGADTFSMTKPRPRRKDATDVHYHVRPAHRKPH